MKWSLWLSQEGVVRGIHVTLLGVLAAWVTACVYCGYEALQNRSSSSTSIASAKETQSRISEARNAIKQARAKSEPDAPKGLAGIGAFQGVLQAIAAKWGCTVTEFQASSLQMGYVTRFDKTTPSTDWVQFDAQATIRGPAPNVLSALFELSDSSVPHEYNTVEIKRVASAAGGQGTVAAALQLRIVAPPGGERQ